MTNVLNKPVETIVESTFTIPLYNGLIKGKSRVDLKKLVGSMDTNVKNALAINVLEHLGLNITSNGEINIENNDKATDFVLWLKQKENFKASLPNKVAKVSTERFALAE